MRRGIRGGMLAAIVGGALALAAGAAWAHGGDPSIIHACVNSEGGTIKIIAPTGVCQSGWTAMDWSVAGPQGPAGATGPTGATGATGPAGPAFPIACPSDSVLVGTTCIDTYEASVWQTSDPELIAKVKAGTVTHADLTGAGATQLGLAFGDLAAADCPATGNGCTNVYAVSIPGVTPSFHLT